MASQPGVTKIPARFHILEKEYVAARRQEDSAEDRELVRRCQNGDEAAFVALVSKYQQTLFNLIHHSMGRRWDVDDIAQKIFIKVYFSLRRFDNSRPFFPWIYRIAVNQCYDELRRTRRRRSLTFSELNLQEAETIENLIKQDPIEIPDHEDRKARHELLHAMLNRLPEKQRRALILRDLENVPYDTLAEIMDCSEQAVRLKVFRARTRLRDLVLKALRRQERSDPRTKAGR